MNFNTLFKVNRKIIMTFTLFKVISLVALDLDLDFKVIFLQGSLSALGPKTCFEMVDCLTPPWTSTTQLTDRDPFPFRTCQPGDV